MYTPASSTVNVLWKLIGPVAVGWADPEGRVRILWKPAPFFRRKHGSSVKSPRNQPVNYSPRPSTLTHLPSSTVFHVFCSFSISNCDKCKWKLSRKNKFICTNPSGTPWQFIIFQLNLLLVGSCPSLIFCCLFTEQGNT